MNIGYRLYKSDSLALLVLYRTIKGDYTLLYSISGIV